MKNLIFYFMFAAILLTGCKTESAIDSVADSGNPFFVKYDTPFEVPPFEKIRPEHYMPAFEKGMEEGREELARLLESGRKPSFENTIEPYSRMGELLNNVAYVFFALTSANTNDSLQNIEMEISPKLSAYSDEITLNPELFKRIKSVYDNQSKFKLNEEQKYILENLYKGFVRNGALLSPEDQDTLRKLNQRIAVLAVTFGQNVLAETNRFKLVIDNKADLKGLPEGVVNGAAAMAGAAGMEGKWVFTTQKPSMLPFLTYSLNSDLRKKLYDAYLTRGNHNDDLDNKAVLAELISLRARRAKLIGYNTHADLNLENRMAKTPANVYNLLNQLWTPALRVAGEELAQMQEIARKEGYHKPIMPSDWWHYAEKLRKEKYNLDDNELRPYFELDNVREGAFTVANKLYGITFTLVENIPLPHPDARAWEVKEADGKHLAILYMDFYTRESKRQGAWCGGYRDHRWEDGTEITPVITVVCNFDNPAAGTPSLLSLDDVMTLFHEFGHALQGIFSANTYSLGYTARDIVELPSQVMEHWAAEPEVLKMYAKHYQSGDIIPDELIRKINDSKYFNTGFDNVEILAASMLDMAYYTLEHPVKINVEEFEKEYLNKIGLIPEIEPRYKSTYFLHIIDGYDAGYYVYTWAAVLDHDAFEAFREKGIFDRATAESFRKNILGPMGIVDAKQSYINFRGRDAVIEPLLKNRGLN
jgi:peptidyl-dipeptidase Dcp